MERIKNKLPPAESAPEKPSKEERASKVSLDGEHFVEVPVRLGKLISIALSIQKRIDRHVQEVNLDFDSTVDIVRGMNCHKTVLFARGELSFEELKKSEIEAEHNGHPEIISLANENPENLLICSEEVEDFVNENPNGFPFSIHVLRSEGRQWIPAHSLLLLGIDETGEKVCFHKAGPYLDMPFEIASLKSILKPYDEESSLFLMLPVPQEDLIGKEIENSDSEIKEAA